MSESSGESGEPGPGPAFLSHGLGVVGLERVDLRYRLRPTERLDYRVTWSVKTETPGTSRGSSSESGISDVSLRRRVLRDDGSVFVQVTTHRTTQGGGNAFGKDADFEESGLLSPLGELRTQRPSTSATTRDLVLPRFAGRAVSVGESWTTTLGALDPSSPRLFRVEYRLESINALIPGLDTPAVAIRGKYTLAASDGGVEVSMGEDSGCKAWFDAAAGRLLRQASTITVRVSAKVPGRSALPVAVARIDSDTVLLRSFTDQDVKEAEARGTRRP